MIYVLRKALKKFWNAKYLLFCLLDGLSVMVAVAK